jgi:hypothetical protein
MNIYKNNKYSLEEVYKTQSEKSEEILKIQEKISKNILNGNVYSFTKIFESKDDEGNITFEKKNLIKNDRDIILNNSSLREHLSSFDQCLFYSKNENSIFRIKKELYEKYINSDSFILSTKNQLPKSIGILLMFEVFIKNKNKSLNDVFYKNTFEEFDEWIKDNYEVENKFNSLSDLIKDNYIESYTSIENKSNQIYYFNDFFYDSIQYLTKNIEKIKQIDVLDESNNEK